MAETVKKINYSQINSLRFDPHNPRLPPSVDGENEELLLDWMLREGSIIELMASIGENGYFPGEPLLVRINLYEHRYRFGA